MKAESKPLFSVLVPAFAAERFVDAAIRSVVNQSLHDWEIVAVDDASKDSTRDILESWSAVDTRIRVYSNAANLGMTANWNRCLREARGALILKLDADDALRPQALEVLGDAMAREHVVGVGMRTLLVDESGEPFGAPPADAALAAAGIDPYRDQDLPGARWQAATYAGVQPWSSSAFAARRDWLVSAGGWDERLGCAADTDLILRLLRTGLVFCHRSYVGLYYRVVPGSISDLFQREGWKDWEALVVYLRNLALMPELLAKDRRARQRRAVLWRQWRSRHENAAWRSRVPGEMKAALEDFVRDIAAPPVKDLLLEHFVGWARGRMA